MKYIKWLGCFAFIFSIAGNIYTYALMQQYKEALIQQGINTAHIEILLKSYEVNLSYDEIKARFNKIFPTPEMLKEVNGDNIPGHIVNVAVDRKILIIGDTKLYFKNGKYYGSQIEWPKL